MVAYYWGLRILAYAYAYAGIDEVDSHVTKGSKVVAAPLDVNLDYADYGLRVATSPGIPFHRALAWLEDRDTKTRAVMVSLMRQGWPQGEALIEARKETAHEWHDVPRMREREEAYSFAQRSTQSRKRKAGYAQGNQGSQNGGNGGRGGKGKGKGGRGKGGNRGAPQSSGRKLCQAFQQGSCGFGLAGRGCRDIHQCAKVLPNGQVCGDRRHGMSQHDR